MYCTEESNCDIVGRFCRPRSHLASPIWLQAYSDVDLLRKIYFSIVYRHLYYVILIWGTANKTLLDSLVKLNNRAISNVYKIHINEQISIKDMHRSTYILEIRTYINTKWLNTCTRYVIRCYQKKSLMDMNTTKIS